jgi:hypothetical protein
LKKQLVSEFQLEEDVAFDLFFIGTTACPREVVPRGGRPLFYQIGCPPLGLTNTTLEYQIGMGY